MFAEFDDKLWRKMKFDPSRSSELDWLWRNEGGLPQVAVTALEENKGRFVSDSSILRMSGLDPREDVNRRNLWRVVYKLRDSLVDCGYKEQIYSWHNHGAYGLLDRDLPTNSGKKWTMPLPESTKSRLDENVLPLVESMMTFKAKKNEKLTLESPYTAVETSIISRLALAYPDAVSKEELYICVVGLGMSNNVFRTRKFSFIRNQMQTVWTHNSRINDKLENMFSGKYSIDSERSFGYRLVANI